MADSLAELNGLDPIEIPDTEILAAPSCDARPRPRRARPVARAREARRRTAGARHRGELGALEARAGRLGPLGFKLTHYGTMG